MEKSYYCFQQSCVTEYVKYLSHSLWSCLSMVQGDNALQLHSLLCTLPVVASFLLAGIPALFWAIFVPQTLLIVMQGLHGFANHTLSFYYGDYSCRSFRKA